MGTGAPLCEQSVTEHRYGKATAGGSPRRSKDEGGSFPHRHASVSSALIPPSVLPRRFLAGPDGPFRWIEMDGRERSGEGTIGWGMVKTMPVPPRPPDDVTDPAHTGKYAEPLTPLRAGSVDIDARPIGRAIAVLLLAALVVVAVVLAVAGTQKNNQIDRLRQDGVPVTITVSSCLGLLLGGSGSNAAGYTCRGTFTAAGHRYTEGIPGDTLYPPGTTIRAVRVPGDPALISPLTVLATEQPSWRVYLLPAVLLAGAALLLVLLVYSRRRARGATATQPTVRVIAGCESGRSRRPGSGQVRSAGCSACSPAGSTFAAWGGSSAPWGPARHRWPISGSAGGARSGPATRRRTTGTGRRSPSSAG